MWGGGDKMGPGTQASEKGAAGHCGQRRKGGGAGKAPGNKELLRGRALGSTYGKRQQEHRLIIPEPPGRASSLHQPNYVPREPARGSHTAIFKTDKNRACRIVGSVCTNLGFAQARPNEPQPITQQLLVLSYPGLPLSQGWGPEERACRASSHLNGNAPRN